MKREEQIKKIALCYAHDELKDNHAPIKDIVAAAFLNGIDYAENHPQWISVEDELPKETNLYIVVHYDVVCTMWWFDGVEEWAEIFVDENENTQSRKMDGVTHWMPLPPAPKKGGEQ